MRFPIACVFAFACSAAYSQGTAQEYELAKTIRQKWSGKVFRDKVIPHWNKTGDAFWYSMALPGGGRETVVVDAVKGTRNLAADKALPDDLKDAKPQEAPAQTGRRPRGEFAIPNATSPDGKWVAFIKDKNVWLRNKESKAETALSTDGKDSNLYTGRFFWAPDSQKLVAMQQKPGGSRVVTLIESSPKDQLQPKTVTYPYLKPGDEIPQTKPKLFDVANQKPITVNDELFANPWDVAYEKWEPDSSRFTFLYNQRGHTIMRVLAMDAVSGTVTPIINEECKTFFDYAAKTYYRHFDKTHEAIWMSERNGWNHLYLVDTKPAKVKNAITTGEWVVRGVDRVDEEKRQIWFRILGYHQNQDPYHVHYARINFDGTGLTLLTDGDGTHTVQWSPDRRYFLDTYSRVDLPPITELRNAEGKKILTVETADITLLKQAGWKEPERFALPGRDGKTMIYGYVVRPSTFAVNHQYPVIENIYAGPHDHHVKKDFSAVTGEQSMAELGFILVKIDGMGTNWRSKEFHDVCWKNLQDAGFPDRIAVIKALAKKHPEFDLTKGVGIYGGSAGGQNTMSGMLYHPEFYTVGVADCGCHDNRMDKIWWNELWMSWPIGPHYEKASNVVNAHKLKGKLLLMVGEKDNNVDPASTMQVANALIKADKDFEMLVVPGGGHGVAGTPYGNRKRQDFFVRNLIGMEPRR